jgi:hypothetical protein
MLSNENDYSTEPTKQMLPSPVPEEGQPPYYWWQDLRLQAVVVMGVTSIIKRFGWRVSDDLNGEVASVITFAFQFVVPTLMAIIGQVKSRSRQEVVSEVINSLKKTSS